MRTELKECQPPKFRPIDLVITIESIRDMEYLLSLTNCSGNDEIRFLNDHLIPDTEPFIFDSQQRIISHDQWHLLEKLISNYKSDNR